LKSSFTVSCYILTRIYSTFITGPPKHSAGASIILLAGVCHRRR